MFQVAYLKEVSLGLPFLSFINDLPNVIKNSSVKIFADDTKAYNGINNSEDVTNLQNVID